MLIDNRMADSILLIKIGVWVYKKQQQQQIFIFLNFLLSHSFSKGLINYELEYEFNEGKSAVCLFRLCNALCASLILYTFSIVKCLTMWKAMKQMSQHSTLMLMFHFNAHNM